MENSNALIIMAHVSENLNNPYSVFCEYIKYCMSVSAKRHMNISELKTKLNEKFELALPHNVILKCLEILKSENFLYYKEHEVKQLGEFDSSIFEKKRREFRITEEALLNKLIQFVAQYDLEWTLEHARKQLIKVLDNDGLAYDIFMNKSVSFSTDVEEDLLPDINGIVENVEAQPLFSDSYYVGRFISKLINENSAYCDYLNDICEGMMVCIGAYQLPSSGTENTKTQIKGTVFYFDTRLLLRYVGCAGDAAVEATKELVKIIQELGGTIRYLPHTLEEMESALDEAARRLANGGTPRDAEMRMYCAKIKNRVFVVKSKKANLKQELEKSNILLKPMGAYTNSDRISFGFDCNDLKQYMNTNLNWEQRTIENDAKSIWEAHMSRRGNYKEYCGTNDKLCVFVTSNSRLMRIALKYREERSEIKGISDWKKNRLPVITDVRLTCRLWNPASQCNRLSMIRLTANVVAAQQLLFFKLFTASCCTLFTTISKIIPNATSHYSSPIMHIKYCYPKTKHII